jgi:signal transduction histidine kinase
MKSLDETVWAVNPRNDTLPHLIDYIGQFAMEFLRTAGIGCTLDLPPHPPDWPVPADVRHHLFLCVKEALNNVVRHGQAGEVTVKLNVTPDGIALAIEDNGHGFVSVPASDSADGLRNMRQRMEDSGGSFAIESSATGTRVSLRLPFP